MEIDVKKLSREAYFMNSDMIKFLLIENLALKTLLNEKGLLDPEEYKRHQDKARDILESKVESQIEAWQKANPKMMEALKNQMNPPEASPAS